MKKVQDYNEESIEVLEGLQAVRVRPGMYVGDLASGRFHITKELLDNAVDEALAGFNKKVGCKVTNDYIEVYDEGRGIPVGIHPKYIKEKKSTLEVIFTTLHAGGKIKTGAYSSGSVGTNGVGSSCTNALSTYFQVWTYRDNKWWTQSYSKGVPTSDVHNENPDDNYKKGTVIRFIPDKSILPNPIDPKLLATWFRNSSFLNPGIEFFIDYKGKTKTYNSQGLIDYINWKTKDLNCEALYKPFILKTENVDVALQWFETDEGDLASWCNTSPTIEGGTHLKGLINVINKGFDNLVKKKNYKAEDLRTGLYGAINYRTTSPVFDSQTKEKLINAEAEKLVMDQIQKEFDKYLNSNKTFVKKIIDRANEIRSIYNKFTQEKKALSKLKKRGKVNLPPANKFISSNCKDPSLRELYCVEGDSAAGTARQARDPHYQEIVKLRGKILNVAKSTMTKAYESEDILNILKAIGFDPSNKEHQLRIGKFIILTDADPDGCLDGNTKILTLDGRNPTIKELAEEWESNHKSIEVYSVDKEGNLVIGNAINPRITKTVNQMIELTLSNEQKILCTLDHKWQINNPSKDDKDIIWYYGLPYKQAKDLTEKDSIRSIYFTKRKADGNVTSERNSKYLMIVDGKNQGKYCENRYLQPVHRFVKNYSDPSRFKQYILAGKDEHIHHIDFNSLNNSSDNLTYLSQEEHGRLHMKIQSQIWNGSPEQKRKAKIAYFRNKNKNIGKKALSSYNVSKAHSITVANKNSDLEQIRLQMLGKCARYYNSLLKYNLKINQKTWNQYVGNKGLASIPRWETLKSYNISLVDIYKLKKRKNISEYYELSGIKNSYPQQKYTKFNRIVKILEEKGLDINEENYEEEKKLHERGVPHWKTIKNHRIISKKIIESTQEVYCMTVPEFHNFMVDDGNGNGICSSNSHISTLLLTLLQKIYPELIENGMVYAVDAPLFIGKTKTQEFYGETLEDVQRQANGKKLETITRVKGWGEANADLLKKFAFDPSTRKLVQITAVDDKELKYFYKIVGDDTETRKEILKEL